MMLARYWHTLRHLKPVQVYGRIWFRLYSPHIEMSRAPIRRLLGDAWASPIPRATTWLARTSFKFLNEIRDIAACGWNDPAKPALWTYNLHYFSDLVAADAASRASAQANLITLWIAENPPGTGKGWDPYPTSLRMGNWIKWHNGGFNAPSEFDRSLATQARWLSRRIERHLLANHLFVNGKALILAGLFFEGPESDTWRKTGLRILDRELGEQVLGDGGHFERSPMYHSLCIEDLLDLVNAAGAWPGIIETAVVDRWRANVRRMLEWLQAMTHPDGELALFNDAAMGVAPTLRELTDYAVRLGLAVGPVHYTNVQSVFLRESGFARVELGAAVLIADVGEIGPDYQPAHAHADTLSFELSLSSHRIIVDTGTSTYSVGRQRTLERSTAAHNTVEIDGCDSSEVWGGFRVARRARPLDVEVANSSGKVTISGSHNGYCRLKGRPVHRRQFEMTAHSLRIVDRIDEAAGRCIARLHFHPAVRLDVSGLGEGPGGLRFQWQAVGGVTRIVTGQWHPQFGISLPCVVLELNIVADELIVDLSW